jgi:3D (Asp-Asp-Asp) domain-containing protein
MKQLMTVVGLVLLFACQAPGGDHSEFARVTVYWHGEGSGANAAWNGVRLREGHCAVDPKKIPYGSKVVFHDAECTAVDSGPDVINRKAARSSGRTAAERNAIVIDRFFATKRKALAWANANPHFMVVQVRTPDAQLAQLDRGKMARVVLNCERAGLVTHELIDDIVMVGRAPSNHIVIDDPTVSAQPALLLRVGASYWLKDLNSTNGAQINGVLSLTMS